jgi:hypothetical protein
VWYRNRKTRLVSIKSNFIAIWSSGGGGDDQRERRAHAKEPWLLTLLFYIVFVATFLMLGSRAVYNYLRLLFVHQTRRDK